jgi:hypothetical protein
MTGPTGLYDQFRILHYCTTVADAAGESFERVAAADASSMQDDNGPGTVGIVETRRGPGA